jgi:hypothetical protein
MFQIPTFYVIEGIIVGGVAAILLITAAVTFDTIITGIYPENVKVLESLNSFSKTADFLGCRIIYKIDKNTNEIFISNIKELKLCLKYNFNVLKTKLKSASELCKNIKTTDKYLKYYVELDCNIVDQTIDNLNFYEKHVLKSVDYLEKRQNKDIFTIIQDLFGHKEVEDFFDLLLGNVYTSISIHTISTSKIIIKTEKRLNDAINYYYELSEYQLANQLSNSNRNLYYYLFNSKDFDYAIENCKPINELKDSYKSWNLIYSLNTHFKKIFGKEIPVYKYIPEDIDKYYNEFFEKLENVESKLKYHCYEDEKYIICELIPSHKGILIAESILKELEITRENANLIYDLNQKFENCKVYLNNIRNSLISICSKVLSPEKVINCDTNYYILSEALNYFSTPKSKEYEYLVNFCKDFKEFNLNKLLRYYWDYLYDGQLKNDLCEITKTYEEAIKTKKFWEEVFKENKLILEKHQRCLKELGLNLEVNYLQPRNDFLNELYWKEYELLKGTPYEYPLKIIDLETQTVCDVNLRKIYEDLEKKIEKSFEFEFIPKYDHNKISFEWNPSDKTKENLYYLLTSGPKKIKLNLDKNLLKNSDLKNIVYEDGNYYAVFPKISETKPTIEGIGINSTPKEHYIWKEEEKPNYIKTADILKKKYDININPSEIKSENKDKKVEKKEDFDFTLVILVLSLVALVYLYLQVKKSKKKTPELIFE